ncbi:hypothetical protein IMCC9480_3652 [Oxalobacteraceae bacterium IMCC9480]|nr:hypothetical protein IMCC9480_3652 [Oxalobacteraceae bacterium IMCC9480]
MLAVGVSLNRTSPFAELQRQAKRGILNHIASSNDLESDRLNEDGGPVAPVISHTV